jgi:hypothetical protein
MMWLPYLASPKAPYGLACGWNVQVVQQSVHIGEQPNGFDLYVRKQSLAVRTAFRHVRAAM